MLNKASTSYRIFLNTFIQLSYRFISVLLSLLTVGMLTRHLGADGYGNFTLVFTYLSFFAILSDLGINQVIVREFSNEIEKTSETKASFFNLKLMLNLVSILLPLLVLPLFPYSNSLKLAIFVGVFAVAIGNMVSYCSSILQSQLRLDLVALSDLFIKLITVMIIFWFTKIQTGLFSMIGAILIGNFFGFCISYLLVKKQIKFKFYLDMPLTMRLLKFGIPVGISSFLALLYFKIDTVLLSLMRPPEDVGIYSLSYKLLENILILWGLYMASVYPLWSRYFNKKDYSNYRSLLRNTLVVLGILSVVVIFIGQNFTFLIMSLLGGNKFYSSAEPFRILLWTVPFLFLNNIFYNVILSFGKTKYLIYPLLLCLGINILLNIYTIPRYGYIGASITTVITEIFISFCYVIIFWRYFKTETSKYVK